MDDLISRQMLLEYIHGEPVGRLLCDKYNLDGLIEQLPSAEPKRGKWISCENETGEGSNTYKCSACGEIQMIIDGTPKENGWAYCPHCGARMNEVEE